MLTEDLEWFVVLAETQQVTATADLTHLSQPTLSRKLARLERQIGVDTLRPSGTPTRTEPVRRDPLSTCSHRTACPSTPRRPKSSRWRAQRAATVRLDFLHSFGTWLVPHMLRGYRVEHPGVRFELHQDSAQFLVDRIAAGTSDLAVVSPQPRDPQVAWMQIAQQSLALAVPADHRFAKLHSVELADAADEPFHRYASELRDAKNSR